MIHCPRRRLYSRGALLRDVELRRQIAKAQILFSFQNFVRDATTFACRLRSVSMGYKRAMSLPKNSWRKCSGIFWRQRLFLPFPPLLRLSTPLAPVPSNFQALSICSNTPRRLDLPHSPCPASTEKSRSSGNSSPPTPFQLFRLL